MRDLTKICVEIDRELSELDRHEKGAENAALRTGKLLIELQLVWRGEPDPDPRGFYAWAADRFRRNKAILKRFASYARHPDIHARDKKRNAATTARLRQLGSIVAKQGRGDANALAAFKSAYLLLSFTERERAHRWLDEQAAPFVRLSPAVRASGGPRRDFAAGMPPEAGSVLLTHQEVRRCLSAGASSIHRLVAEGRLEKIKIKGLGTKFTAASIHELILEARRQKEPAELEAAE